MRFGALPVPATIRSQDDGAHQMRGCREESTLNKRKKVAWRKHRIRRKKLEEKRQIGSLARRK